MFCKSCDFDLGTQLPKRCPQCNAPCQSAGELAAADLGVVPSREEKIQDLFPLLFGVGCAVAMLMLGGLWWSMGTSVAGPLLMVAGAAPEGTVASVPVSLPVAPRPPRSAVPRPPPAPLPEAPPLIEGPPFPPPASAASSRLASSARCASGLPCKSTPTAVERASLLSRKAKAHPSEDGLRWIEMLRWLS
jgi:hypothetical protein